MLGRKKAPKPVFPPDGRKYKLALIVMAIMLGAFALCTVNPVLLKALDSFLAGLGTIYLLYCGGNVTTKWVANKKPAGLEPVKRE
jgi:threonine/homoserine/homoserine lactone efflux protein